MTIGKTYLIELEITQILQEFGARTKSALFGGRENRKQFFGSSKEIAKNPPHDPASKQVWHKTDSLEYCRYCIKHQTINHSRSVYTPQVPNITQLITVNDYVSIGAIFFRMGRSATDRQTKFYLKKICQ